MESIIETAIDREVAAAREEKHPRTVARMPSGWLMFGERQFVPRVSVAAAYDWTQAPVFDEAKQKDLFEALKRELQDM